MKSKVLEALKTKYKNLGFSEKDLEKVADYLIPSITEESNIDEAVATVEPLLQLFQSSSDKLRGEKVKAEKALEDYKKKLKELQSNQEPTPSQEGEGGNGEEGKKSNSEKLLEQLLARMEKLEGEKRHATRKEQIDKILSKLPDAIKKAYSHIDYAKYSDEDYEKFITDITGEAEEISKGLNTRGATFSAPKHVQKAGTDKEASTEEAGKVLDSMNI